MLMREELFSFTGLHGSASRCCLRLLLLPTAEPGSRITADVPRHVAGLGNTLAKNYGENAGLADALARSGSFTLQKEVFGGMVVEMKVLHPALKIHLYWHEQGREQSRGFNHGGNPERKSTGHKL